MQYAHVTLSNLNYGLELYFVLWFHIRWDILIPPKSHQNLSKWCKISLNHIYKRPINCLMSWSSRILQKNSSHQRLVQSETSFKLKWYFLAKTLILRGFWTQNNDRLFKQIGQYLHISQRESLSDFYDLTPKLSKTGIFSLI